MRKKKIQQFMTLALSAAVMSTMMAAPAFAQAGNSSVSRSAAAVRTADEGTTVTMDANAQKVADYIRQLRDQDQTKDYTQLCKDAKAAWDALTDEEKLQVENGFEYGDYFSTDTGDASKDNPRNADGIKKQELLVVSFGTSYNDSRTKTIGAIESTLDAANPDWSVRRGFSSQIIINHVQARDGEAIDNLYAALNRAVKNNVQKLVIQPTTLMYGTEYDSIVTAAEKYAKKIPQIVISKPVLSSNADRETVAKGLAADAASTAGYANYAATPSDTAYVFMGHGTSHEANMTYDAMQKLYASLGYKNVFVGTVEGKPADTAVDAVIKKVQDAGYKKIVLRPMMIVAGDHANNDMAGSEEDSWKSEFEKAGITVTTQIKGLGEIKDVQNLVNEHAQAAMKTFPTKPTKLSVKVGKKRVKVSVTGTKGDTYQIQYSKKKSFKSAKKVTVKAKSKKTVKTIKGLKKGRYYVRVRSYRKNTFTPNYTKKTTTLFTNYSGWTKAKKTTVK